MSSVQALGTQLVAISPQLPDVALTHAEHTELKFSVLSDMTAAGHALKYPRHSTSLAEQAQGFSMRRTINASER
jgi:peroxiredoxin